MGLYNKHTLQSTTLGINNGDISSFDAQEQIYVHMLYPDRLGDLKLEIFKKEIFNCLNCMEIWWFYV